jgi:hypothetical protein
MADFAKILGALRDEERQLAKRSAQIRKAIQALSEVPIPLGKPKGAKKKRARRKMTAAQKKALSKRMKKMWAEKKKKTTKKK